MPSHNNRKAEFLQQVMLVWKNAVQWWAAFLCSALLEAIESIPLMYDR